MRIASPPVSSSPAESRSYFAQVHSGALGTHHGSPPPQDYESASSDDSESDPFNPHPPLSNRDAVDEEGSGSDADYNAREAAVAIEGSRNSASQRVNETASKQSLDTGVRSNTTSNAALDVDAFTRLLLTGNAEDVPGHKKSEATVGWTGALDNLTRTDPSFEHVNSVDIANNPRPPHFDSASSTTRSSVDEVRSESKGKRADTVEPASSERKSKPPLPKTRHGRPIKLDSFAQSTKISGEEITTSRISLHSSPSDTSITLSPESHHSLSTPPLTKASPMTSDDAGSMDDASSIHRHPSQLKKPPTPPLTRRHSQMKPSRNVAPRDRPQRISMPPGMLGFQISDVTSPGIKTPPRPPSRRYDKSMNNHQADSLSQPKSPLSQDHSISSNILPSETLASVSTSSPPSRASSVKRTASGSTVGGPLMPPPPPPPRRIRASSKGSNSSAHPTGAHPEPAEVLPQSSNAEDILADLTRLQKEVDDLRGHYHRKVSE